MYIINIRITHKKAPTSIREKYAFPRDVQERILRNLASEEEVKESVVLVTCNRTELYLAGNDLQKTIDSGLRVLEAESGEKHTERYVDISTCMDAVKHLFEVASGLDSMIIGETQILGQINEAYLLAKQENTIASVLDLTFDRAIKVGKKTRQETGISRGKVSVGSAAVELAEKLLDLKDKKVILLGAGKIGTLVAKSLIEKNTGKLYIVNRTHDSALKLASHLGCEALGFDRLYEHLRDTDLLITATNSPHTIIKPGVIEEGGKRDKPLNIIDISIPRNVDPRVGESPSINLYHMDFLEDIADKNLQLRMKEAERARALIDAEVENTRNALNKLHIESLMGLMRRNVESIRHRELMKAIAILSNSPETRELTSNENLIQVMDDLTSSIVNKILHDPFKEIRNNLDIQGVISDVGLASSWHEN